MEGGLNSSSLEGHVVAVRRRLLATKPRRLRDVSAPTIHVLIAVDPIHSYISTLEMLQIFTFCMLLGSTNHAILRDITWSLQYMPFPRSFYKYFDNI